MKEEQEKIINGSQLAEDIYSLLEEKISKFNFQPCLAVLNFRADSVIAKYLQIKKKSGDRLGILMKIENRHNLSFSEASRLIKEFSINKDIHGLVIQLPLPEGWPTADLLSLLPADKDPDCLTAESSLLSPVVGAIKEIIEKYNIDIKKEKIAIVGRGRLVGRPMEKFLKEQNCDVEIVEKQDDLSTKLSPASFIISGAGKKHIIKPAMLKENTILLDAGLSEVGGSIFGDIDPACFEKARLFSAAKNGLGPVAVACLFANFVELLNEKNITS